ncbi:hypothetical protein [Thauera sp.]|uniref:hypothetical protein n=1 Tax=Thauera sp. TaxID=1905334 RepID=UPI0039E6A9B2
MRTLSRKMDVVIALGIGLVLLAVVLIFGEPLYLGAWYYLLSWLCLVGLVQIVRAPPLFTTGAVAALALSFLLYWIWKISLPYPQGLLGLGHLFSLRGLGIAAVMAAVLVKRRQTSPGTVFWIGLLACSAGFVVAQLIECRTAMYCGAISSFLYKP